jgi:hypothetical protein
MKARLAFDDLLQDLMFVGFLGLMAWASVAAAGFIAGLLQVEPRATLRFLLAVLVLVFSRRTYREIREWRLSKRPPDDRYGFAKPLREHPRARELAVHRTDDSATGSSQAPG